MLKPKAINDRVPAYMLEADIGELRTPPHSIEAETSLLGGLLMDNAAWDRMGDLLKEDDFYRSEHRTIFGALGKLINANKPADVVTVFEHLQSLGKAADVGGLKYLSDLSQHVLSAGNMRRYAEIVRERSILRRLIAAADEISSASFNTQGRPVETILDESMARVQAINPDATGVDWESMDAMLVAELDNISARSDGTEAERKKDYIPTGLSDLDEMLDGGMRPGQLIIIGARPGMGKSAIADTIGIHAARLGFHVGKFSMEMQNTEGAQRALSAAARIPLHVLRRPERMTDHHWSELTIAVDEMRGLPFYSNQSGGLNINQVRAKARALKRKYGLQLLVLDYLQLMSGTDSRAPRAYQLEEASRGLKSLAKELAIPVIACAQVNRGVEKETDPMPRMSDLKDCGAIEQDADVILFIDRPIQRKPDLDSEWQYYAKGMLAKQRGGRSGPVHFQYVGENTRFADWPRDMPIPTMQARTARGGAL